jgi:hypothetical protein
MRQSVAQISAELDIYVVALNNRRRTWLLQGEVVPTYERILTAGLPPII